MSRMTPRMLVLSPHSDDSVLGAGGAMAHFVQAGGEVTVVTVATHMPPVYSDETSRVTLEEARKALSVLGVRDAVFLNVPALAADKVPPQDINGMLGHLLVQLDPHVLLVPFYDRHVDHRAVFEAAMVISRPTEAVRNLGVVAAYEVISSTHYNAPNIEPTFTPNWVVDINAVIDLKIQALACFSTQIGPPPNARSCEAARALAQFRGSQAGMLFGESFQIIRMTSSMEIFAPERPSLVEG